MKKEEQKFKQDMFEFVDRYMKRARTETKLSRDETRETIWLDVRVTVLYHCIATLHSALIDRLFRAGLHAHAHSFQADLRTPMYWVCVRPCIALCAHSA
jgi:hypothetical protein